MAGRPLKFGSVLELQTAIDKYFILCAESERPYSITGLALALDCCRQTIQNYEVMPEFLDTIKRAKLRVENFYEERLTLPNVTGAIFALKNFDWKDTQDVNQTNINPVPVTIVKNYGPATEVITSSEITVSAPTHQ